ncbi:plastocyanin/azurin family copper-binding protein [Geodermatophilus sp. SYSU D00965]
MSAWGRRLGRGCAPLVALLLAVGVLAGCGGDDESAAAPSSSTGTPAGTVTTAPDGVQEVTLQTQDDYVFTPDRFTVAPGQVRLTVVNVAEQLTHNFRFTPGAGPAGIDPEIPLLAPGETRTIEFTVTTPGDYGFECSFHTQLGQVGTMTVSG